MVETRAMLLMASLQNPYLIETMGRYGLVPEIKGPGCFDIQTTVVYNRRKHLDMIIGNNHLYTSTRENRIPSLQHPLEGTGSLSLS